MDSDRKYRQNGYFDSNSSNSGSNGNRNNGDRSQGERPRPSGPRPSIDITGPHLPRLVQAVAASRCYSCSTTLMPGTVSGSCPKCGVQLHCCKQCSHFEPSTRFQCNKPVPVRVVVKDAANDCTLFAARVTVAREVTSTHMAGGGVRTPAQAPGANAPPTNASDARDAFESLFKK